MDDWKSMRVSKTKASYCKRKFVGRCVVRVGANLAVYVLEWQLIDVTALQGWSACSVSCLLVGSLTPQHSNVAHYRNIFLFLTDDYNTSRLATIIL